MKTSSSRIQTLDSSVVDQIAAGEVVERPAHLIKELVENSLDAEATRIHIEFSDGGRFVQVSDNGLGIHPKDLLLALDRHATSKIHKSEDLFALSSFGFRGEALASIAAVSRFSLSSKQNNQKLGAQIYSEFGQRRDVENIGHEIGTRVRVEDLFANMPARLKFLKSASAEATQIKTVIKALALANPQVEFQLKNESELILYYPVAASRLERAQQVLEIENLYQGTALREGVEAYCVYADPNTTAKTSKNIWLFAQNRWVQDRGLQAAVLEAYRNLLMHGEYPVACVWVTTPPQDIDVNIHPTKSQVKFLNPSNAFRAVQASLRDSLEQAPWVQNLIKKEVVAKPIFEPATNLEFTPADFTRTQYQAKQMPKLEATILPKMQDLKQSSENRSQVYWSHLQVLGQAHLTYLICQSRDGLMLVDQHAAHERVLFEKFMSAWRGGHIDIQDFLFPVVVDLSAEKVDALMTQTADFKKLGLDIEQLGPQSLGIKAAPNLVKESVLPDLFEKVATELLDQGGSFSFEKMIADICASLACHSAIRAGQALSLAEMQALLQQMDEFPLSSFCPHGRPVFVEYPLSKLEKDFGRTL